METLHRKIALEFGLAPFAESGATADVALGNLRRMVTRLSRLRAAGEAGERECREIADRLVAFGETFGENDFRVVAAELLDRYRQPDADAFRQAVRELERKIADWENGAAEELTLA